MKLPGLSLDEREAIGKRLRDAVYGIPPMSISKAAKDSGVSCATITRVVRGSVPNTLTANRLLNLWREK